MKIAIAGAGPAGSYLSYELSKDNEVDVFEKRSPEKLGEDCAWGTSMRTLKKYSSVMGLNYEKYINHICDRFISDIYQNKDAVSFDKNAFLLDVLRNSRSEVSFEEEVSREDLDSYDLIIDATGPKRDLLPEASNNLRKDWRCPLYQLDVKSEDFPEDFYFHFPRGVGYLYAFPQGKNEVKVGCGFFDRNPKEVMEGYLSDKKYEVKNEVGAMIRFIPPSKSEPFFNMDGTPVIGVGESVGTVSPASGVGIAPSLRCSDFFLESFRENENLGQVAIAFREKILGRFEGIESQFDLLKSWRDSHKLKQLWNLMKMKVPDYFGGNISKLSMIRKLN